MAAEFRASSTPTWAIRPRRDSAARRPPRAAHDERGAAAVARWPRVTRPPCASTIPATIARPSPAPALPRSRPPSARQKRSNSASGSSVGRPGPWSRTSSAHRARRRRATVDLDRRPGRRVHERVAQQVARAPGAAGGRRRARRRGAVARRARSSRSGAVARASSTASRGERGEVDLGVRRVGAPRRAARASAGPRRARPCAPPRPRSGASPSRRRRARAPRPCGTAPRSRGSTPAACAARARRRR